jgi:tetratricopeptide (TPR) repeat protein
VLRLPERALRRVALLLLACGLSACGVRGGAVADEESLPARREVSAEAVQHVLEGHLAKLGNQRAEQLAALEGAVAADGKDAGLRRAYAEALFLSDKPEEARRELKIAVGLGAAPWELALVEFPYVQRKGSVQATVALFSGVSPEGASERFFQQWRQVAGRADADAERIACQAWTVAYPRQASGWGCLAEVERREGRQELAAGFYRQAAEAGSEAYAGELMGLLLEQGSLAELMSIAAPVAARFRESIGVTIGFAQLQAVEAQGGSGSACETLTALAGRIGGNVRRYADAVSRVRETARPELLRCLVDAALATRGRNEAMVLASASAFDAAGLFDEARPLLERVIEIDPSNAFALNQLGYTLAERNVELSTALGYLERAHRLRPDDGGILDSLAWVYFRLGRFAEAEPLARRAIELAGAGAVLLDHLGDILWALGQKEEAIEQWRMAYWNARTGEDEDVHATVPEKLQRAGVPLNDGSEGEGDGEEEDGEGGYEEEDEE